MASGVHTKCCPSRATANETVLPDATGAVRHLTTDAVTVAATVWVSNLQRASGEGMKSGGPVTVTIDPPLIAPKVGCTWKTDDSL